MRRAQIAFDLVEPIIDVVRKASEAEVAMVVKEDDVGDLRVSLRSKGVADVSVVATALGGGGHRYAAGFTAASRDVGDVVRAVRNALDGAVDVTGNGSDDGEAELRDRLPHAPMPRTADPPAPPAAEGVVVVDKPGGWTSHDVVARMRRLAGTRKVGHAGTLDPMATGVLILGVGRATRLLGHIAASDKSYDATIRLGAEHGHR